MKYFMFIPLFFFVVSCTSFLSSNAPSKKISSTEVTSAGNDNGSNILAINIIINSLAILSGDIKNNAMKLVYVKNQKNIFSDLIKITGSEHRKKSYKKSLLNSIENSNRIKNKQNELVLSYISHIKKLCSFNRIYVETSVIKMIESNNVEHGRTYDLIDKHNKYYCKNITSGHKLGKIVLNDLI